MGSSYFKSTGLWNDLAGVLSQFRTWGVAYLTVLVFKEGTASVNTPPHFLKHVREEYPELLDPAWHAMQLQIMQEVYGKGMVLVGQEGFSSLTHPHLVLARNQEKCQVGL